MSLIGKSVSDLIGKGADATAIATVVGCSTPVGACLLIGGLVGLSIWNYLTDRRDDQTQQQRDEEILALLADLQTRAQRGDPTAMLAENREAHRVAFEKFAREQGIATDDLDIADLRRPHLILQRWLTLQASATASRDHDLAAKIDALADSLHLQRPMRWHLPPSAARLFGRAGSVRRVARLLADHPVVCLIAPGGIGKTALAAAAIAHRTGSEQAPRAFRDGILYHDYYAQGSHEGILRSILTQTHCDADGLLKQTATENGQTTWPAAENEVRAQLAVPDRLLYLEGCEKALDLAALLRLRGAARILITTRDHDQRHHGKSFTVETLPSAAAAALIHYHWEHGQIQECRPLAQQLGGHALACQRAGIQLRLDARSPAELRLALSARGLPLIHPRRRGAGEREHEHTAVGYLFAMDADAVARIHPLAPLAWSILALGALAPVPFGPIPAREKRPDIADDTPEMLPGLLATALDTTEEEAEDALKALRTRSLATIERIRISHTDDEERHTQLTHALLAEHARPVDTSLLYAFPLPIEQFLPAARRWAGWWGDTTGRWNKEGILPGGFTRYAFLTPHLDLLPRRSLAIIEFVQKRSTERHDPPASTSEDEMLNYLRVIHMVGELGLLHDLNGELPKAEALLRYALEARHHTLGFDHPGTFNSMSNLARTLHHSGNAEEAEGLFRQALAGWERTHGHDDPRTLMAVNNLAYVLQKKGELSQAEPLHLRTLNALEKTLGPAHKETIVSRNNLATCLDAMGDLDGAEALYRQSVDICQSALGSEHPLTLTSIGNLSHLLHKKGDLVEAAWLCFITLELRKRILGEEHPSTLINMNNMSGLYRDKGLLLQAEELCLRAVETQERTLPPDHPDMLRSVTNLAVLRCHQGRLKEGEKLFIRAIKGFGRALGAEHPHTLQAKESLKNLREALEKEMSAGWEH